VEPKICIFVHPMAGQDENARVWFGIRSPHDGPSLPCLRVSIDHQLLEQIAAQPEPNRLRWKILPAFIDEMEIFGMYCKDVREPWLVVPADDDVKTFVTASQRVAGLWVLELESNRLKLVWAFDGRGKRFDIEKRQAFVNDFLQSYLNEVLL
jgi:hypothetical protein